MTKEQKNEIKKRVRKFRKRTIDYYERRSIKRNRKKI